MHADDDGPQHTKATGEAVMRYHLCWKHRDLDGVMALYHPDIQYNDFFQNRVLGLKELREYVRVSMPRESDEALEHCDRIRLDGNTAFIQYEVTLRGGDGLVSFRSSEAITVKDGLIWRVNEYASLVRAQPDSPAAANPDTAATHRRCPSAGRSPDEAAPVPPDARARANRRTSGQGYWPRR